MQVALVVVSLRARRQAVAIRITIARALLQRVDNPNVPWLPLLELGFDRHVANWATGLRAVSTLNIGDKWKTALQTRYKARDCIEMSLNGFYVRCQSSVVRSGYRIRLRSSLGYV